MNINSVSIISVFSTIVGLYVIVIAISIKFLSE